MAALQTLPLPVCLTPSVASVFVCSTLIQASTLVITSQVSEVIFQCNVLMQPLASNFYTSLSVSFRICAKNDLQYNILIKTKHCISSHWPLIRFNEGTHSFLLLYPLNQRQSCYNYLPSHYHSLCTSHIHFSLSSILCLFQRKPSIHEPLYL